MNKLKTIILSILGGCSVFFEVFYPILIITIWITLINSWANYILFTVGLLATTFNGIKFWIKMQ
jgi:hypothetical protein